VNVVFSLGVGMKGYLYIILVSPVTLRLVFPLGVGMPIEYRDIPSFLQLKKILTSGLLEDTNIV
jgi:hypothetical protein